MLVGSLDPSSLDEDPLHLHFSTRFNRWIQKLGNCSAPKLIATPTLASIELDDIWAE